MLPRREFTSLFPDRTADYSADYPHSHYHVLGFRLAQPKAKTTSRLSKKSANDVYRVADLCERTRVEISRGKRCANLGATARFAGAPLHSRYEHIYLSSGQGLEPAIGRTDCETQNQLRILYGPPSGQRGGIFSERSTGRYRIENQRPKHLLSDGQTAGKQSWEIRRQFFVL